MNRTGKQRRLVRRIPVLALLPLLIVVGWQARAWLSRHPEHNPWAPLTLDQPQGWATRIKMTELRADRGVCRAVFSRSGVLLEELPATGAEPCLRDDRIVIPERGTALVPTRPETTCKVAAGYERWLGLVVQPAARRIFGSAVRRVEHLGTYSCRKMRNPRYDRWSEHATGNAIDISAFVLTDGRRITVLDGWKRPGREEDFLRTVRDGACASFGTVLSPDYNAAHANHLHLDQAQSMICR